MRPAKVDAGIIAHLRAIGDAKPHTGDMRREIGCTAAELKDGIFRLRYSGKIEFDALRLSRSMQLDTAGDDPAAGSGAGDGAPGVDGLPTVPGADTEPQAAIETPACETGGEDAYQASPSSFDPPAAAPQLSEVDQLLHDVTAWCERTGTKESAIGATLFKHPGYIGLVRARRSTPGERIAAVRQLIADHPDGLGEVKLTRAKRHRPEGGERFVPTVAPVHVLAGPARQVIAGPKPLTLIEALQSGFLTDPADLIGTLERHHGNAWAWCLDLGRKVGRRPALVLYAAIELGLAVLIEDPETHFPRDEETTA